MKFHYLGKHENVLRRNFIPRFPFILTCRTLLIIWFWICQAQVRLTNFRELDFILFTLSGVSSCNSSSLDKSELNRRKFSLSAIAYELWESGFMGILLKLLKIKRHGSKSVIQILDVPNCKYIKLHRNWINEDQMALLLHECEY